MIVFDIIAAISGVTTAIGVGFAAATLQEAKGQRASQIRSQTADFELRFSDRYDDCLRRIPLEILLDESAYLPSLASARRAFYDYFELCEQEAYYFESGQITKDTWAEWSEGVSANYRKHSFKAAWADLSPKADEQFEAFRRRFPYWDATANLAAI